MGPGWNPKRFARNEKDHHIFESVTVIVIDEHNGLCDKAGRNVGLKHSDDELGEQVRAKQCEILSVYGRFLIELPSLSKVIYCYPACPDRFAMDPRLRRDSSALGGMSMSFGCLPVSIESHWQTIEPFGLPNRSDPRINDPWHHADTTNKYLLVQFWDSFVEAAGIHGKG